MRALIVIDLGFGDAGKGLITDFLVRQTNAGVVVRYNGGAQAGHNVVTPDGRHHTFSQFGSGTFVPGVKTYLSKHMVVHPGALLIEGDQLAAMGESDVFSRIRIDKDALIITPYHQAANRIHEMARGDARHGSCGVGVGETVEDNLHAPDLSIFAGDLTHSYQLQNKLNLIRESKRKTLLQQYGKQPLENALLHEWQYFLQDDLIELWMQSIQRINTYGLVWSTDQLREWSANTETMVFEGAQGLLLDADAGFYPYNSWSKCTAKNAVELVNELDPKCEIEKIGVSRCYTVRHGPGPLPTETHELERVIHEHNQLNPWQGNVRYGWFDNVLCDYALKTIGDVDSLAITHLDILKHLDSWKYCPHYDSGPKLCSYATLPLNQKEILTRQLLSAKVHNNNLKPNDRDVIKTIEQLTSAPVRMASHGPSSLDVTILKHM